MVYALTMATVVSDAPGQRTRAGQEETSPFPLEFMLASPLGRPSQDHTSPFPLEFEVVSRRAQVSQEHTSPFPLEFEVVSRRGRVSQDETAPFPLEFVVTPLDGVAEVARVHRVPARALPRLKWRGMDASAELREYAARVASGEDLPPYRGPILASGEFPWPASAAPRRAPESQSKILVTLELGLIVLSAALVAFAILGG
jgi:hypothetical protein